MAPVLENKTNLKVKVHNDTVFSANVASHMVLYKITIITVMYYYFCDFHSYYYYYYYYYYAKL